MAIEDADTMAEQMIRLFGQGLRYAMETMRSRQYRMEQRDAFAQQHADADKKAKGAIEAIVNGGVGEEYDFTDGLAQTTTFDLSSADISDESRGKMLEKLKESLDKHGIDSARLTEGIDEAGVGTNVHYLTFEDSEKLAFVGAMTNYRDELETIVNELDRELGLEKKPEIPFDLSKFEPDAATRIHDALAASLERSGLSAARLESPGGDGVYRIVFEDGEYDAAKSLLGDFGDAVREALHAVRPEDIGEGELDEREKMLRDVADTDHIQGFQMIGDDQAKMMGADIVKRLEEAGIDAGAVMEATAGDPKSLVFKSLDGAGDKARAILEDACRVWGDRFGVEFKVASGIAPSYSREAVELAAERAAQAIAAGFDARAVLGKDGPVVVVPDAQSDALAKFQMRRQKLETEAENIHRVSESLAEKVEGLPLAATVAKEAVSRAQDAATRSVKSLGR